MQQKGAPSGQRVAGPAALLPAGRATATAAATARLPCRVRFDGRYRRPNRLSPRAEQGATHGVGYHRGCSSAPEDDSVSKSTGSAIAACRPRQKALADQFRLTDHVFATSASAAGFFICRVCHLPPRKLFRLFSCWTTGVRGSASCAPWRGPDTKPSPGEPRTAYPPITSLALQRRYGIIRP